MSEDAPVNTGAAGWPDESTAYFAVRRMQTKLHGWAGADASRRFDDLFNLVYDRAFLMHAWERVSSNAGSRTAGVDRATVAWIETLDRDPCGGRGVPGRYPGVAEVRRVPAGRGAAGDDPQEGVVGLRLSPGLR